MRILKGKKIDAVISGGMGPRAVQKFVDAGIKTYRANTDSVEDLIKKCIDNEIEEMNFNNACIQHNCDR